MIPRTTGIALPEVRTEITSCSPGLLPVINGIIINSHRAASNPLTECSLQKPATITAASPVKYPN